MVVLDIFMFYPTTKKQTSKPWSYVPRLWSDYSVVVIGEVFPNANTPLQTAKGFLFSAACLKRQANTCLRSLPWNLSVIGRCIESKSSRQQNHPSFAWGVNTYCSNISAKPQGRYANLCAFRLTTSACIARQRDEDFRWHHINLALQT